MLVLVSCTNIKTNENKSEKSFDDYGPAENLWERWTYPNQEFDQAYFDMVNEDAKAQMYQKGGDDVSWRVEGPLNIGGRINCVMLNPENNQDILIGTSSGGIFRSTNSGIDWEAIGEDFSNMSIGSIAFNPQNVDEIYVGTGDPNISGTPKTGNGVYKSTDGGLTWEHKGPSEVGVVSKLLVHPTQSNIVYMASMGTPYFEDEHRGVYKSLDGGEHWVEITNGLV